MTSTDVARPFSIAGNATLTTDLSMLAIVEARIAADSTQGFSPAEQRVVVLVDRMVDSSHGPALGLITTMTPCPSSTLIEPCATRRGPLSARFWKEFASCGRHCDPSRGVGFGNLGDNFSDCGCLRG